MSYSMFTDFFETSCKVAYCLFVAVFSLRRLYNISTNQLLAARFNIQWRMRGGAYSGGGRGLVCLYAATFCICLYRCCDVIKRCVILPSKYTATRQGSLQRSPDPGPSCLFAVGRKERKRGKEGRKKEEIKGKGGVEGVWPPLKISAYKTPLLTSVGVAVCCKSRYTLATKPKWRSTFGRQKSPTFDKVDRVELWRQCRPRQIERRLGRPCRLSTLSPVCTTGLKKTVK